MLSGSGPQVSETKTYSTPNTSQVSGLIPALLLNPKHLSITVALGMRSPTRYGYTL